MEDRRGVKTPFYAIFPARASMMSASIRTDVILGKDKTSRTIHDLTGRPGAPRPARFPRSPAHVPCVASTGALFAMTLARGAKTAPIASLRG